MDNPAVTGPSGPSQLGYERLVAILRDELPEVRDALEREITWWGDEDPPAHVIYGDVLTPHLEEMLSEGRDDDAGRVFAHLERLARDGDTKVQEVVAFSVLEGLLGSDELSHRARRMMGPSTSALADEIEQWWRDIAPITFRIRLDWRFRIPLLAWGVVGRRNAYARLAYGELVARFGLFRVRTALSNVERWEISGPYRWWTAIGVRGTWGKPEMTFGGSADGGVALHFHRPLRHWWWMRPIAVLYLTLGDLEGFAAELERRGIPGTDVRARR